MNSFLSNQTVLFYAVLVAALLFLFLPKIGIVFRLLNTFIHESGHAIVALVTSGTVCNIKLNRNTSGQALTTSKYWISKLLTSLAGYSSCTLVTYVIFYLASIHKYHYVLWGFIALAAINLIFWVRNTFGIVWLALFMALNIVLIYYSISWVNRLLTLFFAFAIFFENIYSSLVLLKIAGQEPKQSGDAANLAATTYIPAFVWALAFNGFAGYFAYLVVIRFFPLF